MAGTYTTDERTGTVTYRGATEITPADRHGMPARTADYPPGYDRGHLQAVSLGGNNSKQNIAPQHADVNRAKGGWYGVEQGERAALKGGATVQSEKTAFKSDPSALPEAYLSNDAVTYRDGHTETISHSFTNISHSERQAMNEQSAVLPDTFDAPNPSDSLRASRSSEDYAALMDETDQALPSVAEDYAPADFSGVPASAAAENAESNAAQTDAAIGTDAEAGDDAGDDAGDNAGDDAGNDAGNDAGSDAGDGGASPDD